MTTENTGPRQFLDQNGTERRLSAEELRKNEAWQRKMVANIGDVIVIIDKEGTNHYKSPNIEKWFGWKPEEVVGASTLENVHPEDKHLAQQFLESLLNEPNAAGTVQCRYRCKDGSYKWIEFTGINLLHDSDIQGILGNYHDITERKQAEANLKRIEWMLSGKPISNIEVQTETHDQGYGDLTHLNREGIILKSIGRERLEIFADDYMELLGTSSAIYEANGDYAFGIFASGWCRMLDRASRRFCETSDNAEALNSGRWLCHESCWTDCAKLAIAECAPADIECNGGIRMYAVPILANGNVVGAINFGYGDPPKDPEKLRKLAETYQLDYDDLVREANAYESRPLFIIELAKKRLHATAGLIGAMIETKQAEESLRDSESFIKTVMDHLPIGIAVNSVGPHVEFSYMNEKFPEIYRITREALSEPGAFWDVVYEEPVFREKIKNKVLEDVSSGDPHRMSWEDVAFTRKGQGPFYICARNIPFEDKQVMISTVWDVTQRKQAEQALQSNYALLQIAGETAGFGGWSVDLEKKYLHLVGYCGGYS